VVHTLAKPALRVTVCTTFLSLFLHERTKFEINPFSAVTIVTVACKRCVPSGSDVFLSKNDNSGGKTREASEGGEYDFYFTEYDFCPII
jgi:hypothetical protein